MILSGKNRTQSFVMRCIDLLNSFDKLYDVHSQGKHQNYLLYFSDNFPDEKTFIQPTLFPKFLKEILNFSSLDYIPEKRNKANKAPDFTPIDTHTHNFIFETKGTDSSLNDLNKEFHNKSKLYLEQDQNLEFVIITNMRDFSVYSKSSGMKAENLSFSVQKMYQECKKGIHEKSRNTENFLEFVSRFRRKELTSKDKLERILNSEPHEDEQSNKSHELNDEKILESIKKIIFLLKTDVATQGISVMEKAMENDSSRKKPIINEINQILKDIVLPTKLKQLNDFEQLKTDYASAYLQEGVNLYFYRIAYFVMTRMLLIRSWEDAKFISPDESILYNGGLKKWYESYNHKIQKVLEHAYSVGKEKYQWLFKDDTNYSWYTPTSDVLIEILYEMAQYDFSELNKDVLGTLYEQYLDRQDRKNKGQYYTPHTVVEFILDRVGFTNDEYFFNWKEGIRHPKLIYDSSSGSGSFLVEASKRIRKSVDYSKCTQEDLIEIKNCIINGVFGSEIIAFPYYLSEVNILLQLTPIIKQIIKNDHTQEPFQGKFTLGLLHENALKLYSESDNKVISTQKTDYKKGSSDSEYLIDKPKSEKANVFSLIKNEKLFDYCVSNPPYIGESGHKELFRNTISEIPYWKKHYQGKMDYLYWFIMLAISKLKPGGKLGFITTSYWLTADGAEKVRKMILEKTVIKEMIFFGQVKLFKDAQGQNSLIFILEKEDDEKKRNENNFKVVKFLRDTKNNSKYTISEIIEKIQKHIDKQNYKDGFIEIFPSATKQKDLDSSPWFLFHKAKDEKILAKIEKIGKPLNSVFNINEGLVTGCNKIDSRILNKITSEDIEQYDIKSGDGVFVLSQEEVSKLKLNKFEKSWVRPFYKSSNIQTYWIDESNNESVLYLTKKVSESKIPNIISHLGGDNGNGKFKNKLEMRRECQQKSIPWYSLQWPRNEDVFDGEKIVFPYRSPSSKFAYTQEPFYGASDMYFITSKKEKNSNSKMDLKYLLGIVNSTLFQFWFAHKSNVKDGKRELFGKRMEIFPLVEIDFENIEQVRSHDKIVKLTNNIILKIKDLREMQKFYKNSIVDKFGMPIDQDKCMFDYAKLTKILPDNKLRKISSVSTIKLPQTIDDFKIKSVQDVSKNFYASDPSMEFHLIVIKSNSKDFSIEGQKESLEILKEFLDSNIGNNYTGIWDSFLFPIDQELFKKSKEELVIKHKKMVNEIMTLYDSINDEVCKIYNVTSEQIIS